jgi:chitinase
MNADKSKTYYVTGAPQCPFPDQALSATINTVRFDAVYVQFCESSAAPCLLSLQNWLMWLLSAQLDNNKCGLQTFGTPEFDMGTWDTWANTMSPNKDVKVFIGAPGSVRPFLSPSVDG